MAMNFLDRLNRYVYLFVQTFGQVVRGRIWLPLVLLFLLRWLVLEAHSDFLSPIFYPVMSAWLSLFPEAAVAGFTHYPGHLLLMPFVYDWARFVIGLLFEGLVLGGMSMMFFDSFLQVDKEERMSWRVVVRSWLPLTALWLVLNALMLAVAYLLPLGLSTWLEGSPRRQFLIQLVLLPTIYVFLLAMMYTAIPAITLFGESVGAALGRSIRLFWHNPFTCLFLAGAVLFVPILLSFASGQSALIVQKLRPELVYWLLLVGMLIEVPVSFVWMGTAVRFLIDEDG